MPQRADWCLRADFSAIHASFLRRSLSFVPPRGVFPIVVSESPLLRGTTRASIQLHCVVCGVPRAARAMTVLFVAPLRCDKVLGGHLSRGRRDTCPGVYHDPPFE